MKKWGRQLLPGASQVPPRGSPAGGGGVSPKWCPQLFLTIIFLPSLGFQFNHAIEKHKKRVRFGVRLCFKP